MPPGCSEATDNTAAETLTPCDDGEDVQQSPNDAARHRVALSDIVSRDNIDDLTVRQLKSILVNHYVDYRGCCEKQELVDRVHELWTDHRKLNETGESPVLSTLEGMLLNSVRGGWSKILAKHDTTTTTPQPLYGPFSGTTRVSRCQNRTSGLYGARED